jgi:hypothetical protein
MATALKLKNDIKKLKAALKSKATPKAYVPKLETQLKAAEAELKQVQSGVKPKRASSTKKTEATLSALQKLIKKKGYEVYRGAGVDLKRDAREGAMKAGRRVSKGLKANQYGSQGDNKGNVYYEYRPNHIDVKQPKRKQTYPKLEKGGFISESEARQKLDELKKRGELTFSVGNHGLIFMSLKGHSMKKYETYKEAYNHYVENSSKIRMADGAELPKKKRLKASEKQYNKEVDAYNWYIVDVENKKAVSGWEFKEDAKEALSDYDGDKNFKVVSERQLKLMGVSNPKETWKYDGGGFTKGNMEWTKAEIGDSAVVISENKIGLIVKPYGRKFHLRFPDGSEKTYDASELKFIFEDDDYASGGYMAKGGGLGKFNPESLVGKLFYGRVNHGKIIDVKVISDDNIRIVYAASGGLTIDKSYTKDELFQMSKGKSVEGETIYTMRKEGGYMAEHGMSITKGDPLESVKNDAKSMSVTMKQPTYVFYQTGINYSNNTKTGEFTWGIKEDLDAITDYVSKNSDGGKVIFQIVAKFVDGKEVMGLGGYMERGGYTAYNTGRSWAADRRGFNKKEAYEIPMKNRKEHGGELHRTQE